MLDIAVQEGVGQTKGRGQQEGGRRRVAVLKGSDCRGVLRAARRTGWEARPSDQARPQLGRERVAGSPFTRSGVR